MTLQGFQEDLKEALRKGDTTRRDTIRLILSALNYSQIAKGADLEEGEVLVVLQKEATKRRESIEAFSKGNRPDLVAQEKAELQVILGYLPPPLTREEIAKAARQAIAESGAQGPRDMGKVMGRLMPQLKGRAEGQEVNAIVQELLSGKRA
ncbi:MAG TPA: GatB/YqeY domain-containing protein [Dehalococcoidia bacterium]|nr:GatB/YqeY domain-containing protein [Dehalococcoidia bacterium]